MSSARFALIVALTLPLLSPHAASASPQHLSNTVQPASETGDLAETLRNLPVMFVENMGQFHLSSEGVAEPRFQVRGTRGTLYFTPDAIWMTLRGPLSGDNGEAKQDMNKRGGIVTLRLSFVGANPAPQIVGFDRLSTRVSYFMGNDPAHWRPDVPVWGGVRYVDLYPGLDLEITSQEGEWVWRLGAQKDALSFLPGRSSLDDVRLRVEGAEALTLNGNRLLLSTTLGEFGLPLIQAAEAIEVSKNGPSIMGDEVLRPYVFPPKSGPKSPLGADGNLAKLFYSTYLGGSLGDCQFLLSGTGASNACFIAVNANGEAYITGWTLSTTGFPSAPGYDSSHNGGYDVFVAKLNSTGSSPLVYFTYLGGIGDEFSNGIAVDGSGNAYVTGFTTAVVGAGGFPPLNAYDSTPDNPENPFITKLSSAGTSLLYSTFIGGGQGLDIATYGNGKVYVVGQTGTGFPIRPNPGAYDTSFNGFSDGFIAKFDTTLSGDLSLLYSTYFGGSADDCEIGGNWKECAVATDATGFVYVMGMTKSSNFPLTSNAYDQICGTGSNCNSTSDVFVAKLNPVGSGSADLLYSTYLGGSGSEDCYTCAIAVDANKAVYVVGQTTSANNYFATVGTFDPTYNGGLDGFMAKIDPALSGASSRRYATYLGSSYDDATRGVALNADGSVNMTGYTKGSDPSAPFPFTEDAFDTTFNGGPGLVDAFVTKLDITRNYADALLYSTFLGGSVDDYGSSTAVNANEAQAVYVVGSTLSSQFPTTSGALDTSLGGFQDAFVTKLAVPSPWTRVYYVGDITKLGDIGTTLGIHDRDTPGTQDHVVVLDFGAPDDGPLGAYGAKLVGFETFIPIDDPLSSSDIIGSSLAVAQNYRSYSGNDVFSRLRLVIGTNNSIARTTSAQWIQGHGAAWANMMDKIRSQVGSCCYPQVTAIGGSDMEQEDSNPLWTGPYSTTLWVNSYVVASDCIPSAGDAGCFYDYGTNSADPAAGSSCSTVWWQTWTQCDVWYISWGVKKNSQDTHTMARPLPQIYNTGGSQAKQWKTLSDYSVQRGAGSIYFVGSLTQSGACQQLGTCPATTTNTPGRGWIQLWAELYGDTDTRQTSLRWLTDIKLQCFPIPAPTICQP